MSLLNSSVNYVIVAIGFCVLFLGTNVPCSNGLTFTVKNSTHNTLMTEVMMQGSRCLCDLSLGNERVRDDYLYTPGIGAHKLHTTARTWNQARKICIEEGGHLAIINSIAEANILKDIFERSSPIRGSAHSFEAFIGIHDLYSEGDWVTLFDESIAKAGYTGWTDRWSGQPDNWGGNQHCGAFMTEGALDDVACNKNFGFFCELPTM